MLGKTTDQTPPNDAIGSVVIGAASNGAALSEKWGCRGVRGVPHIEALCFWSQANLGIPASHWHFHSREFIAQFRQCGWLGDDDLTLIIPRYPYYDRVGGAYQAHTTGSPAVYQVTRQTARTRLEHYLLPLKRTMQRYGIRSPMRQAHFLAQTVLETDRWRTMREYGQGAPNPAIPMAEYYAAFYGRGIMQLT